MRDLRAFRQYAHRLHQAQLLPPLPEGHAYIFLKQSLDGSPAGAGGFANLRERAAVAGIGEEYFGDTERARFGGSRKLQRNSLDNLQLIEDYADQVALPAHRVAQGRERARVEDELPQLRRHVYHGASSRKSSRKTRAEIQRAHRDCAGHADAVRDGGGDPDGAVGRDDPRALVGAHGHHSPGGIDQLVTIVKM
jgi:hypothetical protein